LLLLAGAVAVLTLALPSASSAAQCTPPYCQSGTVTVAPTAGVKKGRAAVTIACSSVGPCSGTLLLVARVKKGKRRPNVVIGIAPFELAAGKSETLTVKLSGRAKRELRRHRKLRATATGPDVVASKILLQLIKRSGRGPKPGHH
jgi:hypothetical protein